MSLLHKVKRSLIREGRLKRYLLYAIGEIMLIMIGVLLAFQINKWNEKRNNKKAEILYYQNIKRQLNEDMGFISRNLDYNNRYLSQFDLAIQIIEENDRNRIDTLVKISSKLFRYSDFHRASNIYETIVSSGQIKLLQNPTVIEELQRLEEDYVYINKMEDIHLDVIKLIVIPDLIRTIDFNKGEIEKPDQIYSVAFKNRFTIIIEIMKEKNDIYAWAIQRINHLIELIDNELKSNKQ